jgi:hypothetical protein
MQSILPIHHPMLPPETHFQHRLIDVNESSSRDALVFRVIAEAGWIREKPFFL